MRPHVIIVAMLALSCLCQAHGQNNAFNSGRVNASDRNASAFNADRKSNFNDYRQKLNVEYVRQVRQQWNPFNACRGIDPPDQDIAPIPPVVISEDDRKRSPDDTPIPIDEVIRPEKDRDKAVPIAPIQEYPDNNAGNYKLKFYSTEVSVRRPSTALPTLNGTDENAVADMLQTLAEPVYNNLVIDCIKLKSQMHLSDWAYLMLLKQIASQIYAGRQNEATVLMAFVYSQSGYKMRIARQGDTLDMLYASRHNIYDSRYFYLDNDRFYPLNPKLTNLHVCSAHFPKEKSLSLWIEEAPTMDYNTSESRMLASEQYSNCTFQTTVNQDLVKLYDTYPTSEVGGNFMTRWAMYANTPLDPHTRERLYSQINGVIAGLTSLQAAERILNWVQTAFVYEYDTKVWGRDRAFFAEETLNYPYCDCEDRSILFTRIVRDVLHLDCVLVYYPGHLAAAVDFKEPIKGDYIEYQGRRFTVCDPTYIRAPVGRTMPRMDNSSAKVILLQ